MSWNNGGAEQYTGTFDSASSTVTFTRPSHTVIVVNADGADNGEVSFDGGTSWTRILPLTTVPFEIGVSKIVVRCDGATTAAATGSFDIMNIHGR